MGWRLWHGAILGAGVVAYLTADEDFFRMHQFAGYLFVALVVVRLLAAVLAGRRAPFTLRRPERPRRAALEGRGPLARLVLPWMAAILLVGFALAGASGVGADWVHALEGIHEALGEATPWLVAAHVAVVLALFWRPKATGIAGLGRRLGQSLGVLALVAGVALAVPQGARAGSPQEAVMAVLATRAKAEDPTFTAFDPARGEALYLSRNAVDPQRPSCAACHTPDPRTAGSHARTGRSIDPMAVSVNPDRVSDIGQMDKRFGRDCPAVLGRDCTALEQGDFAAFLLSR
jgi:mono/diheme cytochrome c family protein